MKKFILIIISLLPIKVFAQADSLNIPYLNKEIIYQDTVNAKGLTKKQLYDNAKKWVKEAYHPYRTKIETEDNGYDHLTASGVLYIRTTSAGIGRIFRDKFSISIDLKDGKYRYRFHTFLIHDTFGGLLVKYQSLNELYEKVYNDVSDGFTKRQSKDLLLDNDTQIRSLITLLKNKMIINDDF